MSAVEQLWKGSTKTFVSLCKRYWLLASQPAEYFEKFIKDKKARELRQTIGHTLLAVTALTLLFGASFSFKALAEIVPAYAQLVLTKQYPLVMFLLVATAPAFLLFYIVYRVIGASISDLVFIHFNVLTFWILTFFSFFVLELLIGIVVLPFAVLQSHFSLNAFSYWAWPLMIPVGAAFYTWMSAYYYVPLVLFEKSTKRSTLFASGLCCSALMLCFVVGYLVTQVPSFPSLMSQPSLLPQPSFTDDSDRPPGMPPDAD